jgi:hypothetical protein
MYAPNESPIRSALYAAMAQKFSPNTLRILQHLAKPTAGCSIFNKIWPALQYYKNLCKTRTVVVLEDEDSLKTELKA